MDNNGEWAIIGAPGKAGGGGAYIMNLHSGSPFIAKKNPIGKDQFIPDEYTEIGLPGMDQMEPIIELPLMPLSLEVRVQPNPAQDILHVFLRGIHNEKVSVSLISTSGKEAYHYEPLVQDKLHLQIAVQGLAEGVYMLRIKAGGQYLVKKIMITR